MRTLLSDIIKESPTDFFRAGSTQAKNFNEIKKLANAGWKKESGRNKKWNCEFLADKLAMLWVLHQQASKSKQRSSARAGRSTSATSNNDLKRAFQRFKNVLTPCIKLYEEEQTRVLQIHHRTLSLDYQRSGTWLQDAVPFDVEKLDPDDYPACGVRCTMPVESLAEVNAANERERTSAGGEKFVAKSAKRGCYGFDQNCFGDANGAGCWKCVELAKEGAPISSEAKPGECRFGCGICTAVSAVQ